MTAGASVHAPDIITKQLAFGRTSDAGRRVRISTNFLPMLGFAPGMPIVATPIRGQKGLLVEPAPTPNDSTHIVYDRSYKGKGRTNKPFEAVVEFSGQAMLDKAFPAYTERFHVEMRNRQLVVTPIANRVFSIINKFRKANPLSVFVALTGGVDIHAMEAAGLKAEIVLEHRPQEARDIAAGRNLTEVHALNTLFNSSPALLLNEDIHHLELDRLARYLAERPPIGVAHYCFGCDDYATVKSEEDKKKSVADLSTMVDMIYPALKQIELMQPAVVFAENVRNFANSAAFDIFAVTLRRLGYHVTTEVQCSLDFGSHQGRNRLHLVASVFPGFKLPQEATAPAEPIWNVVDRHLADCNDITDTKTMAARAKSNRASKPITRESTHCGTIMKSQNRCTKDALYIEDDGRIFAPSEGLIKELMGIPESFHSAWMAKEQSIETLGQSVDYRMHKAVMSAIREHLELNCGRHSMVRYSNTEAGNLTAKNEQLYLPLN